MRQHPLRHQEEEDEGDNEEQHSAQCQLGTPFSAKLDGRASLDWARLIGVFSRDAPRWRVSSWPVWELGTCLWPAGVYVVWASGGRIPVRTGFQHCDSVGDCISWQDSSSLRGCPLMEDTTVTMA